MLVLLRRNSYNLNNIAFSLLFLGMHPFNKHVNVDSHNIIIILLSMGYHIDFNLLLTNINMISHRYVVYKDM